MSIARTKAARFGDNISRPTTTTMRRRPSFKSSLDAPMNRSLSQPPSSQSINEVEKSRDLRPCEKSPAALIEEMIENALTPTDISVKSEDFIDALDESLKMDSKDGDRPNTRLCSIIRKNSSSGIPRAVSANKSKTIVKPCSRNNSPSKTTTRINSGPSSIPRKTSSSPVTPSSPSVNNRRTLELQFITKKKKLDSMKRELSEKQKPIVELYHTLQQLKKKLDECGGKPVVLEALKFLDNDASSPEKGIASEDISKGGGEHLLNSVNLDADLLVDMKTSIKQIPASLLAVCKRLMTKRSELLDILEKSSDPTCDKDALRIEVESLREDSVTLDEFVDDIFTQQESVIEGLITKWSRLLVSDEQPKKNLEAKIKKQEHELREITGELQKLKQEIDLKNSHQSTVSDNHGKLSEKINILEKQLDTDKRRHLQEADKFRSSESNVKTYKLKIKDLESSKQHMETKIAQLMQDIRNMQGKQKQQEKSYEKEICDLNKSRHLDKTVIEKLTKDKSTFEIRIRMATENMDTMRSNYLKEIDDLNKQLEDARNRGQIASGENNQLREECQEMQKQITKMEVQTQQAVDLMQSKHDVGNPASDNDDSRECELKIEVVAQRATIRSLQEKCEANAAEKLRFISTIEKMNGTTAEISDSIVKALVKKEEDITRYDLELRRNEDLIERQKMEIEKLHANQNNMMQQQMQDDSLTDDKDDIKKMLREGKAKLGEALKKSLEDEHKIIRYEHELSQKTQDIHNLENLLKVRDGLIGVVKAKKDEIFMENQSLTKYSEEIRAYVLEAKEDLKQKSDLIVEQQTTLDQKLKDIRRLEKQVSDLEDKLALTNERRYKLQDTVSFMEKELQATKAQIGQSQHKDIQTRYDLGQEINFSEPGDGPVKIKITVA